METAKKENEIEKISISEELEKIIDPLDKGGNLKKAKEHGSAQQVNNIPDNYESDSIINNY